MWVVRRWTWDFPSSSRRILNKKSRRAPPNHGQRRHSTSSHCSLSSFTLDLPPYHHDRDHSNGIATTATSHSPSHPPHSSTSTSLTLSDHFAGLPPPPPPPPPSHQHFTRNPYLSPPIGPSTATGMVDYDRYAAFHTQVNAVDPTSPTINYMSHYRGSPHFSHLDPPSSAPSTPSPPYPQYAQPLLSQQQQQQAAAVAAAAAGMQSHSHSRQPTSYPSPSMSSYNYQPPPAQPTMESYRTSPTPSGLGPLHLPPLRTAVSPSMGSPLTPGAVGPPAGYYTVPPQSLPPPPPHMNITSSPHGIPMGQSIRYPLPPPDARMMTASRNKKEIKRRTKTGCLTCRRRRIKVRADRDIFAL